MSIFSKPTQASAAVRVAQCQAHCEATLNDFQAAQTAYGNAVQRAAAADVSETLELRRTGEQLERKKAVHARALDVLAMAQQQAAAAQARADRQAAADRWANIDALQAKRALAAREFQTAAEAAAQARRTFEDASRDLWSALDPETRHRLAEDRRLHFLWGDLAETELQRSEAIADPRRGWGIPKPPPITKAVAGLDAMARRWRDEALSSPAKAA